MPLTVGSTVAHYDVTALIGEGGMGQVYQATDTTLHRQVALKILPEAFATDPDRLLGSSARPRCLPASITPAAPPSTASSGAATPEPWSSSS